MKTSLILALVAAPIGVRAIALPPPPEAFERPLERSDALVLVSRVLHLSASGVETTEKAHVFQVAGFTDSSKCPLEGMRGVRCGEFTWQPSVVTVYRRAFVAALSGHLARNLVVAVDLGSSSAPLARSTMHGVLVFPTPDLDSRPAFAWYLSRLGSTVAIGFADVNQDGALDVIYTYEEEMPGGVRVVPRDVWSFVDMRPARLISAGENLSGVALSLFEGVPLAEESDGRLVRGAWRLARLGTSTAVILDRGSMPRGGFELRVLSDLGSGWRELLVGAAGELAADAEAVGRGDPADCTAFEPETEGLDLSARRLLLDLESVCVQARQAFAQGGIIGAWSKVRVAMRLESAGLEGAAAGVIASAASDLLGPGTWPVAAVLSAIAVLQGHGLRSRLQDPNFGGVMVSLRYELNQMPALLPLTAVLEVAQRRIEGAWQAIVGVPGGAP